jgi:FKBP-type peptidyl-prolyl cis-trans isomerase SlyD
MHKGDFVKISYVGRLESGEVFDLTDAEIAKKEGVFALMRLWKE